MPIVLSVTLTPKRRISCALENQLKNLKDEQLNSMNYINKLMKTMQMSGKDFNLIDDPPFTEIQIVTKLYVYTSIMKLHQPQIVHLSQFLNTIQN